MPFIMQLGLLEKDFTMILKVEDWIKSYEGLDLMPYVDTVGKLTIGWGRNLQDNGIRLDEAQLMFNNDYMQSLKELEDYAWFQVQPISVKNALINMNFNLGINRLNGFKKMINALINRNYTLAAQEALNSRWANQVGKRATDVAIMIREGK